jgi:membrane-associated phospholipid phosphatase
MVHRIRTHLSRVYSRIALLSAELIVILISFIAAAIVVILTIREIFWKQREQFDHDVFRFLTRTVSDVNTDIMQFITFFGSPAFLIPAYLILITWFLAKREKWYSIKIPAVGISSLLLMFLLKELFNRPRPLIPLLDHASGLSFPSGHAFMSFSFFGLLVYIVYRHIENSRVKWALIAFFLLFILAIGFSRIYLRVHYASDVAAGFSLGLMWLVISLFILRKMEKFSAQKLVPDSQPAIVAEEKKQV